MGLNSLFSPSALASCTSIPDKPLVTFKSDVSGIDFIVSPATTGCTATQLNYTYAYYDPTLKTWESWTKWAVGSSTGKSFTFKVPSVKGKSRVTIGLTASNKWGISVVTRENQIGNGVEFKIASVESVFEKEVYRVNSKIGTLQVKLRHPEFVECGVHAGFVSDNCRFNFEYDLTTDVKDSKEILGVLSESIYLDIVDEKGVKIGAVGRSAFQYLFSYGNTGSPISASANVKVETIGKFKLASGANCDKVCRELASKEILFKPITQEEANKRQAAVDAKAKRDLEEVAKSEAAQLASKKLTINCLKGKTIKKVTGDPPTCPTGFKNPSGGFATFQAFSNCQLYKMDALVGGAQLRDGGRTLILDGVKDFGSKFNSLSDFDYRCAARVMKMPAYIQSRVGSTRAIDGMQTAQWGKISAFWNFHPDNGLDITFNTK